MIPANHPKATRRLGAPLNWEEEKSGHCGTLPIRDLFRSGNIAFMESLWEPTPAELEALNRGGKVVLQVQGFSHPVVALGVGEIVDE